MKKLPYRSPEKPITLAEISKAANVSTSSVSAFLNDRDYGIRLGADTRRRIMATCRELDYRPKNPAALARIFPELGDICFIINQGLPGGIQHQYFGMMLAGVVSALEDPTSHVAYSPFDSQVDYLEQPQRLPQSLRYGSASRLIAASTPNLSLVRAILKKKLPFVYLGHYIDLPGFCGIVPAYAEATRQSVHYLAKQGHRHIAYVTGPFGDSSYNLLELQRGFVSGMRESGLSLIPQMLYHCDFDQGRFTSENLVAAADFFLSLTPPCPTAIMCFHDPAAAVISARLQERGIRVPGQMSVMGCNDEPTASSQHPALSTIHFPLEEMGRRAVRELETQIECGRSDKPSLIELPVSLVERASCASPPGRK